MSAADTSDTTTVITMWPMAAGAYDNLPEADRDVDARYHMATLHLLLTQYPPASALADTILAVSPNNLVGYYLKAIVAEQQGDSTTARSARAQFLKYYPAEIAKEQSEYLEHRPILDAYFRRDGGK
jgi:hypothetical protein